MHETVDVVDVWSPALPGSSSHADPRIRRVEVMVYLSDTGEKLFPPVRPACVFCPACPMSSGGPFSGASPLQQLVARRMLQKTSVGLTHPFKPFCSCLRLQMRYVPPDSEQAGEM